MFSIYNSVSNLGALNIGSVLIVILIDQLAVRPILAVGLVLSAKFILYQFQVSIAKETETTKEKSRCAN
jgi:nitrate reductase NapE component